MSGEENEALIDFERELEDGRLLKSDILLSLDTGVILLDLIKKQQKEIKDWFEIADNILRATNDYGNITIGDIPKYIEKQQKEIEELKKPKYIIDCKTNKITKLTNDFISKDKIRDYKKAIEWKRQQEIENMGMSMLGSAIDVLNKLLVEN